MRRLFILRPEPGAGRTLARARSIGLEAVAMPLFAIEAIPWSAPDSAQFDGLLLSSANAVLYGGPELERLRGLPVYAVGPATAEAASKAGFEVLAEGDNGVDPLLAGLDPDIRLLHICGEHLRPPADARQWICPVVAYRSASLPAPPALAELEGQVAAVHSPRAARQLRELAGETGLDIASVRLACISEAAADAAGAGWERSEWAARPSDELLLALAARLCDKSVQP